MLKDHWLSDKLKIRLTTEACDGFIKLFDNENLVTDEMTILSAVGSEENNEGTYAITDKDERDVNGIWINQHSNLTDGLNELSNIVSFYTGLDKENQESYNLLRYSEGHFYKQHPDYFIKENPLSIEKLEMCGNRVYSMLFYLNDDFEGGQTKFPEIDKVLLPRKQKVVLWRNIDKDKNPITESMHESLVVTKGVKYAIPVWIREKTYQGTC